MENNEYVIFFDGVCNLCNAVVNFVIDRDTRGIFKFAPLQGVTAQRFLKERGLGQNDFDSIILCISGQAYYVKSEAALEIAKKMGGYYRLLGVVKLFPLSLRDKIYDWVAKNRYKWYGKTEQCRIPTPELMARFLE